MFKKRDLIWVACLSSVCGFLGGMISGHSSVGLAYSPNNTEDVQFKAVKCTEIDVVNEHDSSVVSICGSSLSKHGAELCMLDPATKSTIKLGFDSLGPTFDLSRVPNRLLSISPNQLQLVGPGHFSTIEAGRISLRSGAKSSASLSFDEKELPLLEMLDSQNYLHAQPGHIYLSTSEGKVSWSAP